MHHTIDESSVFSNGYSVFCNTKLPETGETGETGGTGGTGRTGGFSPKEETRLTENNHCREEPLFESNHLAKRNSQVILMKVPHFIFSMGRLQR